ncbi:hypothetical protein JYU34_022807 [Plutella xylostella]|uniref:Uncharacterized protein n=2 Tax=Plutella xylostella TaxID=51655 RepID=A0ABQ7PPA6_PLUXY|nr:hypothetical protein JYU34_022807 [Plutella xylostella]
MYHSPDRPPLRTMKLMYSLTAQDTKPVLLVDCPATRQGARCTVAGAPPRLRSRSSSSGLPLPAGLRVQPGSFLRSRSGTSTEHFSQTF